LGATITSLQWQLSSGFSAPSTTESPSKKVADHDSGAASNTVVEPIGTALIDYSTATEFIEEHYHIPHYFGEDFRRTQPVYDARKGVIRHNGKGHRRQPRVVPAKLDDCGFELFKAPTQVRDFADLKDVQAHYINELQELIPKALGVDEEDIEMIVLWHPTMRGEELSVGSRQEDRPGLGPIASRAHIDTDVGAFGLEGTCNLIDKNRVDAIGPNGKKAMSSSIKDDLLEACEDQHRMILMNIWRPLVPVSTAPLGVLATQYDPALSPQEAVFPKVAPSREGSQWYIFSNMQPDECLIFKQYDRQLDKVSDIWHCALNVQETEPKLNKNTLPRKSFDIKAMVVLKQQVPPELDRFKAAVTPGLTWEESGEFCNSQAERLKQEDD
jgi:hypothetical protein